jgi:hypothetical protein
MKEGIEVGVQLAANHRKPPWRAALLKGIAGGGALGQTVEVKRILGRKRVYGE